MTNPMFNSMVRTAFDQWAPSYENEARAKIAARGYSYEALGAAVAAAYEPSAPGPVLEVGVGTGLLGHEVSRARNDIELHGIDISPAMLSIAQSRGIYRHLDLAAADEIDYKTSYPLIYSAFAFHSFRNQSQFLDRVLEGLIEGGKVIIVDLFPSVPLSAAARLDHSRQFEKGAPSNYIDRDEFKSMVKDSGYSVVSERLLGEHRDFEHVWYQLNAP